MTMNEGVPYHTEMLRRLQKRLKEIEAGPGSLKTGAVAAAKELRGDIDAHKDALEAWRTSRRYPSRGDYEDEAASLSAAANRRTRAKDVKPVGMNEMAKAQGTYRPDLKSSKYNASAVQKEINKDKRIGGKEAKAIHALLKGRTGDALNATCLQCKMKPPKKGEHFCSAACERGWMYKHYPEDMKRLEAATDAVKPVGDANTAAVKEIEAEIAQLLKAYTEIDGFSVEAVRKRANILALVEKRRQALRNAKANDAAPVGGSTELAKLKKGIEDTRKSCVILARLRA